MTYWDGERWLDERSGETREPSKARRAFTHSWQLLLEGSIVALLVVGLVAGTAFAGKGGGNTTTGGHSKPGSGGRTIVLQVVTDVGASGPTWGDTVTFKASTPATTEPHVRLQCKQSGTLVYSADAGMYASYPWPWEQGMTLSSSKWTSGA